MFGTINKWLENSSRDLAPKQGHHTFSLFQSKYARSQGRWRKNIMGQVWQWESISASCESVVNKSAAVIVAVLKSISLEASAPNWTGIWGRGNCSLKLEVVATLFKII
jgi:hypothetical protein